MICKKLLDFIEYKDELCALNWKRIAHLLHQKEYSWCVVICLKVGWSWVVMSCYQF